MKLICYSLFSTPPVKPFEYASYVRGFYFNCRMNSMIYPDWQTHLEVDQATYTIYQGLFDWLKANSNLSLNINKDDNPPLCRAMMWRLKPLFYPLVSHILCRDADAITTYREALCVQDWLESNKKCHVIHDVRGHDGLMGGMVGFTAAWFKSCMEANSWEQLLGDWDFSQRGSDQNWMNAKVMFRIKDDLMTHGGRSQLQVPDTYSQAPLPQVNPNLWESNLTCRHIGSAGVVEMETIRFFNRFEKEPAKFEAIEKQFPQLFYWHL